MTESPIEAFVPSLQDAHRLASLCRSASRRKVARNPFFTPNPPLAWGRELGPFPLEGDCNRGFLEHCSTPAERIALASTILFVGMRGVRVNHLLHSQKCQQTHREIIQSKNDGVQ